MATKAESVLVTMPMGVGVDESVAAEILDPNTGFLVLENCRQTKRGAIEKRRGFTPTSSARLDGTSRASCARMFTNNGTNLCAVDSTGKLDVLGTNTGIWTTVGRLPECTVSRTPLAHRASSSTSIVDDTTVKTADMVELHGYRVTAFMQPGAANYIYVMVTDASTGALVLAPSIVGYAIAAHDVLLTCASGGSRVHLVYIDSSTNNVYRRTLDLSSTSTIASGWSVQTSLFGTLGGTKTFDVCSMANSWALIFTSGANQVTIATYSDAGVLGTSTTQTVTGIQCVAIAGNDGDIIWTSLAILSGVSVIGRNPSSLVITSSIGLMNATISGPRSTSVAWTATGRGVHVTTDVDGHTYYREFYQNAGATTATGVAQLYGLPGIYAATRPWVYGGRFYVGVTPYEKQASPNAQRTLCIIDFTDAFAADRLLPRVVATIAPRIEMHNSEDASTVIRQPHHVCVSGSRVSFPIFVRRSVTSFSIEVASLSYVDADLYSCADMQGVSHVGAGSVAQFDGVAINEANFFVRPQILSHTLPGGGGGISATTGRYYVAIYEMTDARGNVHRSAPSDPYFIGPFAGPSFPTLSIRPLTLTNRFPSYYIYNNEYPSVRIVVYRTTDSGVTYYRHSASPNVTSSDVVQMNGDNVTDTNLAKQGQLYTQPGLLGTTQPHASPPCLRHVITHRDRIIGVGDDGYTLWPSAPYVYGEGTWWGDVFQLPISDGGKITALASQDGRLYVFKKDRIFVIDGDGPSENGAAGEFTQPAKLPTELGCVSHRSIAVAPGGIFFQSTRGIEVLSRGGMVQWVGERVQSTLALYPVITSAVSRQEEGRVYFTCTNAAETAGVTLVFDYAINETGVWSVDKFYDSELATTLGPASHALSIYGDYYRSSKTTGRVWREYAYSLDNSSWITSAIETAWIKPAGMHGQVDITRAILIGKKEDYCNVIVRWAYDYRDDFEDAETTTTDVIEAVNTDMGRVHVETMPDNNRLCMSVRLRIEDSTPTNAGLYPLTTAKGVTWFGYTIEGQTKPGGVDLPETARG